MSDPADELEGIIKREYTRAIDRKRLSDAFAAPADAILDAGYRKLSSISTVEEFDALNEGAVVLDSISLPVWKREFGWYYGNERIDTADIGVPATVLWEPRL